MAFTFSNHLVDRLNCSKYEHGHPKIQEKPIKNLSRLLKFGNNTIYPVQNSKLPQHHAIAVVSGVTGGNKKVQ